MASASLSGLSASVTRILSLTGFPKELKTKDIQAAFSEWDGLSGGFKIKWRDDTSLLIVFQDATVAKRAYLNTIANPPSILTSSAGISATIKPYDGPDAQSVIQTVNARGQGQHNSNPSRRAASISGFPGAHGRAQSVAISPTTNGNSFRNGRENGPHSQVSSSGSGGSIPEQGQLANGLPSHHGNSGREHSPTLPNLPSHPTLNALISSSLGEGATHELPTDPAILATSLHPDGVLQGAPRIGDPGKRMLGAALGVKHPGLTSRGLNGGQEPSYRDVTRAMGGLIVAE